MATRAKEPAVTGGGAPSDVTIRAMRSTDLRRVVEIEQASFAVPWTLSTFRGLLNRTDAHLWVAEEHEQVVGYAAVWIVLDQAELGDIAVVASRRGHGIGARLLATVIDGVRERGVRELFLEVRVSNQGAQRLYERHGFTQVGQRRGYYTRPTEDALVLRKLLDSTDRPDGGSGMPDPLQRPVI